jgi:hypothetical protein
MSSFIMVLKSPSLPGQVESKKGNFKCGGRQVDILHMLAVEGRGDGQCLCVYHMCSSKWVAVACRVPPFRSTGSC